MSLFAALMGDVDEDPFYMGGHMRQMNQMNQMMNSFFRDPFQDMLGGAMMGNEAAMAHHQRLGHPHRSPGNQLAIPGNQLAIPGNIGGMVGGLMMPFGFPNLGHIFQNPNNRHGSGHMTSMSSTVMTMTQGPDGRPQVYQASTSTRQGPGGVRETKKTVSDSRTGVKKMSIGHHIYDRAHVIEREQNVYSGDQEERQEFINLDEDEAENFNQEWVAKTKGSRNAIGYGGNQQGRRNRRDREQLALPSSSSQPDEAVNLSTSRPQFRVTHRQYNSEPTQFTSAAARIAHSQLRSKRKSEEDTNEDEPKTKTRYIKDLEVVDIEEVDEEDLEVNDSAEEPDVVDSDSDIEEVSKNNTSLNANSR